MEVSKSAVVCLVLIVLAFLWAMFSTGPAKATAPASAAIAQSIQARDAGLNVDKVRREWQARYHPKPRTSPVISAEDMAALAWERATWEVKRLLKTPSVAQFPRTGVQYAKTGTMTWRIQGSVDTQNSFGAMIRETYQVTLRYAGVPDSPAVYEPNWWIPEALQIGTQHYGYHDPRKTAILDAQQRLTTLGYKTGSADGIVGPATQAALQAFLADQHLPPVTGDITTALLDAVPAMQQRAQQRATP